MTLFQARKLLIVASLTASAASFCFFVLAPVLGYPLRYAQAQTVLQIVLPVFLGYLGAASQFVFKTKPGADDAVEAHPLMLVLIRGPIAIFALMMVVLVVAFGYSNRAAALPGDGMTAELLSAGVTTAIGLLAVTTHAVVAYLFAVEKKPSGRK